MNILIVSFDKNLVSKIKEVLSEHNLVDVKNGEEAINTVSSYMDVVIYDAVSGSISEEDINNMYKQKFKDSKYIILVDDLFPVDMNNIMPPRKVKVMRDEVATKIKDAIVSEPEAVVEEQPQEVSSGEELYLEDRDLSQPIYTEGMMGFREFDLEIPTEPTLSQGERVFQEDTIEKPLKKLLLVSFDTTLINNIREAISGRVEILEARNIKEALEKAKESDIILFDTISGMLAYRTLMDMSREESLAKKPYVLLIDELFTIDVGGIPLERKYSFAREAELSKAIDKVLELAEELPAEYLAESLMETPPVWESLPAEPQPITPQEEERGIMSLLEEIIGSGIGEEEAPALAEEATSEIEMRETSIISEGIPNMESVAESIATAIKDVIREQLSQEKVLSFLSSFLNPEEVGRQIASLLERRLEEIIGEKINEAFSRIDMSQIVREEAYKVLKEKLNELIT
ncbi:hypothetical protein IAE16_04400 [Hydrogenobacter sp. T-2]|uniref:hypothetical protein n=1 Tax=Pampinifervens diazotrophicum TaxID=1632018 RepID=UPI002B25EEF4|nr:hypothetical protein [Hydrogenobacter sp. T-2]WPM32926.1 hypothetical protein IAE16_04400 [Hydrogenobacter sp. T-2]